MRHILKSALCLSTAVLVFAACQASTSYNIIGVAHGTAAGDTIFLTNDFANGIPLHILVADEKGEFAYSGETDTTELMLAYLKNQPEVHVPFFLEPGTIKIELKAGQGKSKVSGTTVNDNWQLLNDTINSYGEKIQRIMQTMNANAVSEADQKAKMSEMEGLNHRMMQSVLNCATANIDNELGFFVVTNYSDDEVMTPPVLLSLISKMPESYQKRPVVARMKSQLAAAASTAVGNKISDLKMSSVDGSMLSLLTEVGKHKLTVVDFWASWCGPCRQEMPNVKELYRQFSAKGLGVVGISLDNSDGAWKKAISQMELPWTHMSDLKGWQSAACQVFGINAIPMTLVVKADGTILAKGLRGQELHDFVAQHIGE